MFLSDVSVKRPVFASVLSLLLIAFGLVSFTRLPLREYPDIDPPIVSVDTVYRGAAANVVESRITEIIEERIAGIEGIRFIESISEDGRSRVTIQFDVGRDINDAANDIRDRVSGILDDLPVEAEPPDVQKNDASDEVILWLNLSSDRMTVPELSDYAERYLVDRFSVLDGVARVRVGGGQRYAMRIWLDRVELAARGLTVEDVESALRAENVELPAGSIESLERQFTVRVDRTFRTAEDFQSLVLGRSSDGYLVRLADVARVERGSEEDRSMFRGNGRPMVGIGIIKQSVANTISVARLAKKEARRISETLPPGMELTESYDGSVFVEGSIHEVYTTLWMAIVLVIFVIYAFLGNFSATIVPAVTVPVSIVATFIMLYMLGYSINLLTLLGLVLAIGMVVDDAIVVLENVYRRMAEEREPPLVAAYRGAREVGFAIIATTLVLVSVFIPLLFLEGDLGRLFAEFAVTMSAAVGFSSLVALSLSPMLASKLLRRSDEQNRLSRIIEHSFTRLRERYSRLLLRVLGRPAISVAAFLALMLTTVLVYRSLPNEYAPREDRGAFFMMINGPEGASYSYMEDYMDEIESRMLDLVEQGDIERVLVRAPRSFGSFSNFNNGMVITSLAPWGERREAWDIMADVDSRMADLAGVRVSAIMRQGFGGRTVKPVQFVIGGGTYEELAAWRDILLAEIEKSNPGLQGIDWDYKETKPQLRVRIDYNRAAELGVTVSSIGRTLETMLGSRQVTTYIDSGEEYDVILEGERDIQRTPNDLTNIYVRSQRSNQLIPLSNLVVLEEIGGSTTLNRYNRVRSITIDANLEDNLTLGEALDYLVSLVRTHLPDHVVIDYKGRSQDFRRSEQSIFYVFLGGMAVVFLVLAAQFESWVHPFVIMLTVPLALFGGVLGIWLTGGSLNIYTQIGLIMLVGLAAKNGILIVEFANQLRDRGMEFTAALVEASQTRLRPILMTSVTTAAGAVPLVLSSGPGAETRQVIGVVMLTGMFAATVFTLWVIPVAYQLLARRTSSPGAVAERLARQEAELPQAKL